MYYIYILKSSVDNKLYTGFSSDLKKRLRDHIGGEVQSTRNRRPLELLYYEAYRDKESALKREKFLKTTRGKQLLRKQINVEKDA